MSNKQEFLSPVGRLVQGGMTLRNKLDDNDKPVMDEATGQPVQECFMAIAFPKNDPAIAAQFAQFWAQINAAARANYPSLFDANGNCLDPRFSFKYQDGDGVNKSGKSVADKPGFAGHHIIKMSTRFPPRCFHEGKFDPAQMIPNPDEVIKRGYWVRIGGTIAGNGVQVGDRSKVPGIIINPSLVSLVGFGEEITSGPNAADVFGKATVGALPAGASAAPSVGVAGLPGLPGAGAAPAGLPGLPGAGAAPAGLPGLPGAGAAPAGLPGLPGAAAAPAGLPPAPGAGIGPPPAPAAPQYAMTPSAQGASREALNAQGWTDEMLIQHGYMVQVG